MEDVLDYELELSQWGRGSLVKSYIRDCNTWPQQFRAYTLHFSY